MAKTSAKITWTLLELYRDFGKENIFLLNTDRFVYFPKYNEVIVFNKNGELWSPTEEVLDPNVLFRWARSRGHNQLANWIKGVKS